MTETANDLVASAIGGDRKALEAIIKSIQDRIYRLAVKMLYTRQDAEDASQEILIKIITRLDSFRRESSFSTWALTIAVNHIKNRLKNRKENWFSFQRCEAAILKELPDSATLTRFKAEQNLVVEEMRIACMHSLLQCLDSDHRLAYILGSAMELSGSEGAAILEISEAAFRKRLSRARTGLRGFLLKNCDLFQDNNQCNCTVQAISAVKRGEIKPNRLKFAGTPLLENTVADVEDRLAALDTMTREVALMRLDQEYQAPGAFVQGIKEMIENRNL